LKLKKPASRWQAGKDEEVDRTPRVDSTRMQLDPESRIGMPPVFPQSFGKYRKDERCRSCGRAKRKKTKGRKSTISAARQTCAEVKEKAGELVRIGQKRSEKGFASD
jgi:hypothetical protein